MGDAEMVRVIIVAVVGVFSGGGLWAFLTDRAKLPVSRDSAAVANANDLVDKAVALAERAELAAQRADERSKNVEARQDMLEDRLRAWKLFGWDLHDRWPLHRASSNPPPLPE